MTGSPPADGPAPARRGDGAARLRVAIDATALLDPPTGVGVVVGEVLDGVARSPEVDVTAFALSWRGRSRLADVVPPGVPVRSPPLPARVARLAWSRTAHPSARWLAGPVDVVHGPNHVVPPGGGAGELVTVHDLGAVRYPELCTAAVRQWPELLERSLPRGAWVHAVTEAVAAEVRAHFPAAGDRVVTIPNGLRRPGRATAETAAEVGHHLAGGDRYLLALGTVEPRKDLPSLVTAFDALAADDPDLRLVIAGPDGWGAEELTMARRRARHRRRIVRIGWVGGPRREALLRGATAVAYPSRYEGFGLVPLEALAVGTPVVATAVPALQEVLGDGALLVEPGDVDALAGALARVCGDDELRADLVGRGSDRVDAYRWEDTVAAMVDLYHRVARS